MAWQRQTGLNCSSCPEIRRGLGLPPKNCATCDYPGLLAENLSVWEVFHLAQDVLFDGWGGVNLGNARDLAEAMGLVWTLDLVRKLLTIIKAVQDGDQRPGDD